MDSPRSTSTPTSKRAAASWEDARIMLHSRSSRLLFACWIASGGVACSIESAESVAEGEPLGEATSAISVAEATGASCSTAGVKGLSLQIIAQANCSVPGAFAEVPALPNVDMNAEFPFLEEPARDAFVAAVNSKPGMNLGVNSMLRTVAEQYMLYRWYLDGRCGIDLAATPGNSNHESGLAFDTNDYSAWRSTLEAHGFVWLGSNDVYHFDYRGPGAVDHRGEDVKAFQILWNRNHPEDPIAEDGDYGPMTEARLKASPAEGFAKGAECVASMDAPDIHPSSDLVGALDRFSDGPSAGVLDVFVGEEANLDLSIANKGAVDAAEVLLGVEVDAPYVLSDYTIETPDEGGMFVADADNDDPANPAHGEPLGASFEITLKAIAKGGEKRVRFAFAPTSYSVDQPDAQGIRVWVKKVDDVYAQAEFGGAITDEGKTQTFGMGRLELPTSIDVYSRRRYTWDGGRLEGWSASEGGTATVVDGALKVEGTSATGPETAVLVDSIEAITIRAKRAPGAGDATLKFITNAGETIETAPSVALAIPADNAFHDLSLPAPALPAGAVIHRLVVVPFAGSSGSFELDALVLEGATPPTGEDDDGDGGEDDGASASASCDCSTSRGARGSGWWAIVVAAFAFASRRRSR